jgi:hypothetical protein
VWLGQASLRLRGDALRHRHFVARIRMLLDTLGRKQICRATNCQGEGRGFKSPVPLSLRVRSRRAIEQLPATPELVAVVCKPLDL